MSDAPLTTLHAILLGLIQALTEFLPVSSSGHLVIGQRLLGVESSGGALFEVAVHVGTLLSIIVVLRADVCALLKGLYDTGARGNQWQQEMHFILLSMIPAGVVGALFKDELESAFSHLWSVGIALIFTSLILLSTHQLRGERTSLKWSDALLIGCAQAIAILPGVSRSGSTISAALWLGIERARAARLSFLMSLPVIGGAGLLKGLELSSSPLTHGGAQSTLTPILVGSMTSFVFGIFALSAMLRWISKPSFAYFGLYCLAAGGLSLYFGY